MREILFKAKRTDNGEWVEGFLMDENCINTPFTDNDVGGRFDEPLEVDPDTICQYTGLTDKNGQKIWENDIVKHESSSSVGKVKWYQDDYIGWIVDDIWIDEQQYTYEMFSECEVIGNVFDNPELLKEK